MPVEPISLKNRCEQLFPNLLYAIYVKQDLFLIVAVICEYVAFLSTPFIFQRFSKPLQPGPEVTYRFFLYRRLIMSINALLCQVTACQSKTLIINNVIAQQLYQFDFQQKLRDHYIHPVKTPTAEESVTPIQTYILRWIITYLHQLL